MRRYRARRRAAGLRTTTKWGPRRARDLVLAQADLIRTLARAHGATSVQLFGSAARAEETEASDLDFLVELEPGRSLLDLIGFGYDLEALLGRRVDAFTAAGLKARVRQRARKEAIRIV